MNSPLQKYWCRVLTPVQFTENIVELVRLLALQFAENSPFRAAAAKLVSQITLDWLYVYTSIDSNTGVLKIGPEIFEGETKEMELGRLIFPTCGPYVRRIVMKERPMEEDCPMHFVEQCISYVHRYCRTVEEITFWRYYAPLTELGAASSFFREYAGNLRRIDFVGEEDVNGFSDLRKCTNLRRLKSDYLNTATLVSVFQMCGSTLEHLHIAIEPVGDSAGVMEAIRSFCKKLSVIVIENLRDVIDLVGQDSYTSLIRGYGAQLRNAKVDELDHEHLVEVVDACPSLEITVDWEDEPSVDWQHVYEMGPRVAVYTFVTTYCMETNMRGHWNKAGICDNCSFQAMRAITQRWSQTK